MLDGPPGEPLEAGVLPAAGGGRPGGVSGEVLTQSLGIQDLLMGGQPHLEMVQIRAVCADRLRAPLKLNEEAGGTDLETGRVHEIPPSCDKCQTPPCLTSGKEAIRLLRSVCFLR